MKKILSIFSAALLMVASCDDPIDPVDPIEPDTPVTPVEPEKPTEPEKPEMTLEEKLVGDWHCTATSADAEIYVTFTADKTFALYQLVGEGSYRLYNGTWSLDGTTLSGKYNDGTEWGSAYEVTSDSDDSMKLTAGDVVEKYDRLSEGIPEEVTSNCVTVVKSSATDIVPFL